MTELGLNWGLLTSKHWALPRLRLSCSAVKTHSYTQSRHHQSITALLSAELYCRQPQPIKSWHKRWKPQKCLASISAWSPSPDNKSLDNEEHLCLLSLPPILTWHLWEMSLFLEFLTKLLWGTGELHHRNELWLFFFSSLKTNMQNFLNVKIFSPPIYFSYVSGSSWPQLEPV